MRHLDTEPNVEKMVRKVVEERGYDFSVLENVDYPDNLDEYPFDKLNFGWIERLKLNQGDWAFIISFNKMILGGNYT